MTIALATVIAPAADTLNDNLDGLFGDDTPIDWASLESHVTSDGTFNPPTKRSTGIDAKVVKFPCQKCHGSGKFRGFGKCFACGGKGHFLTSERDRMQARQTRAASKTRKLTEAREAFESENPGVSAFLRDASRWSTFAAELVGKLGQYGALTDGQLRAVRSMQSKVAARQEERQAARKVEQAATVVDLSPIRAMFETAVSNGYKRPVYRAADLVISRAPDHGRNPGALYIKSLLDDSYLGKIIGTNYTGKPAPGLVAIAADPKGEAIRYGQKSGTCSCCGRELTAEASVEAGIGPICRERWGL